MIVKEMKQETLLLSYFLILYDYVYVILYVNVNENEIF